MQNRKDNMLAMSVEIVGFGLEDKKNIKKFANFPWKLYAKEKFYVPQLKAELLGNKLFGIKGLLTPEHTYHENAEVYHFLAYRNGKIVGRVSAAVNHAFNDYLNCKVGNFGFFDTIDDLEVTAALLDAASAWVKDKGMEVLRGPGQYSNATHEIQGILMDHFHDYPCLETTYNYPYYATLLEKYGMRKAKDYYAFLMSAYIPFIEKEAKLAEMIRKRTGATTRTINMKNLKEEVGVIIRVYNEAWKHNWGFIPITKGEADNLADTIGLIANEELIRFAMMDGKEIAVVGFLPDLNEILRKRRYPVGNSDIIRIFRMLMFKHSVERYKFFFLGIVPEYQKSGIDSLLAFEIRKHLPDVAPKARKVEASLLLEENEAVMNLTVRRAMAHLYKTYRIYEKKL